MSINDRLNVTTAWRWPWGSTLARRIGVVSQQLIGPAHQPGETDPRGNSDRRLDQSVRDLDKAGFIGGPTSFARGFQPLVDMAGSYSLLLFFSARRAEKKRRRENWLSRNPGAESPWQSSCALRAKNSMPACSAVRAL